MQDPDPEHLLAPPQGQQICLCCSLRSRSWCQDLLPALPPHPSHTPTREDKWGKDVRALTPCGSGSQPFQIISLACPWSLRICENFSCFLPTCFYGGSILLPRSVKVSLATHFPSMGLSLFRIEFIWLLSDAPPNVNDFVD